MIAFQVTFHAEKMGYLPSPVDSPTTNSKTKLKTKCTNKWGSRPPARPSARARGPPGSGSPPGKYQFCYDGSCSVSIHFSQI